MAAPDPNEPVPLTTATTEFKAVAIARALEARGIPARVIGALTTGFRAEAPGVSTVTVLRRDLERAQAELKSIETESAEIDWSKVDLGPHPDAELHTPPPASSSEAPPPNPPPPQPDRPQQPASPWTQPPPRPLRFPGPGERGERGPSEDAEARTAAQSERRWAWTMVLAFLLPIGGILTVLGRALGNDPVIRAVGPIIIGVAVVMVIWLASAGKGEDGEG